MSRRDGPTLAGRSRVSLGTAASPESPDAAAATPPVTASLTQTNLEQARTRPVGQRHCWVTGLPEAPGRFAGVVLSWRHLPGEGWSARTVYVVDDGDPVLIEAWVPADYLRPA